MTEIVTDNFNDLYPQIENRIKNAKIISLDTEFSALYLEDNQKPSLFDTAEERYAKLKITVSKIKPLQIGVSTFEFNPDDGNYKANTFTFYIWPRPFLNINQTLLFKASSFQFLGYHNFDFNKLIYRGLPFLNRTEETGLRELLKHDNCCDSLLDRDIESCVETAVVAISKWFYNSNPGETYAVECTEKFINNAEALYAFHKHIRSRFQNELWTFVENKQFTVRKVTVEEYQGLAGRSNLQEEVLSDALGFTRVYRLLADCKKPIVGHNLFMDLMLLYHTFEQELPSYKQFKAAINKAFPAIYDTKTLSFTLSKTIAKNKLWKHNTLPDLYEYFKDLQGRHLAFHSPLIEMANQTETDKFHDAGWDSYCTGYIFIRMAHIFATLPYKVQDRVIMSTEHLAAVEQYKNSINLIRCSVSGIQLDGKDPESTRPPCLIAQANKRPFLNISQVTSLLSTYGYVEIKSFNSKKAIIAVDNYGSAKRILRQFNAHSDFQIRWYNSVKHSGLFKTMLWSGILASGSFLVYLAHKTIKK